MAAYSERLWPFGYTIAYLETICICPNVAVTMKCWMDQRKQGQYFAGVCACMLQNYLNWSWEYLRLLKILRTVFTPPFCNAGFYWNFGLCKIEGHADKRMIMSIRHANKKENLVLLARWFLLKHHNGCRERREKHQDNILTSNYGIERKTFKVGPK